jgi:hypothetical protein
MLGELVEWVLNLDPAFAFLLALPFVVALAGFLSEAARKREPRREPRRQPDTLRGGHNAHVWSR